MEHDKLIPYCEDLNEQIVVILNNFKKNAPSELNDIEIIRIFDSIISSLLINHIQRCSIFSEKNFIDTLQQFNMGIMNVLKSIESTENGNNKLN